MASHLLNKLHIFRAGQGLRIGVQLILVYIVLIGVSGLAFTYQAATIQAGQLDKMITGHALDESRTIAMMISPLLDAGRSDDIRKLIKGLEVDTGLVSLYVIDSNRRPIASTSPDAKPGVAGNSTAGRFLDRLPRENRPVATINKSSGHLDIWQPIGAAGKHGWMNITYSLESIDAAENEVWNRFIRTGYMLTFAATLLLILLVRKPVVALERYKNFASGLEDIEGQQVEVHEGSTELAQLGYALNRASKRLREQNELHKSTMVAVERLAAFSENSPNILISLDSDAQLQYINPRGQDILRELGHGNIDRLLPQEYKRMCATSLKKQVNIEDVEIRVDDRVFLWSFSPVPGQQLIHAFATEITRRKRAEEMAHAAQVDKMRAEAANEAKSRFLANVSHELRTPLNAIIGYSEILEEDAQDSGDHQAQADANRIQIAAKHLLHLINEILDLSKIEAGKMDLYYEPFEIKQVIDDILETVKPAIRKNNNTLRVDCDESIGFMVCDMIKLRQTLFNLLSNAAKFTTAGEISLVVKRHSRSDQDWLLFEVKDNGIGIEPAQQQRLFDVFVQADNSTTRKYGGTGLGLSISRKFCQMLGGTLTLASTPGVGTTFSVCLPSEPTPMPGLDADPGAEIETAPATRRIGNTDTPGEKRAHLGRMLVIDDDITFRDSMIRYFQGEGFKVATASNGQEGLLLASELKPDLITLDILMPGRNGWSVLMALKKNPDLESIPVLMISSAGDRHISLHMGADEYLCKPVNWERLDRTVKKLFRQSSA